MPKLSDAGTTRKISISQIIKTGNVRADYSEIEDLAASIKKNTLLEPILVKLAEPGPDGEPRYELIAGHRRVLAHEYLTSNGDDFSMIEAKIVTGDKLTLQLVENLQRSDLSPRDREKAIFQMSELPGITQRDIAAELSKTEFYISRQIAAYRVRKIAEEAGIDTSELETSVMCEIQTAAEKDIPMLIGYTIRGGGTKSAAKAIMRDYRPPKKETPAKPEPEPANSPAAEPSPPMAAETQSQPPEPEIDIDPLKENAETPVNRGERIKAENPEAWQREPIKNKQVDLNDVFTEIYGYLSGLERKIRELGPDAKQAEIEGYKEEATLDIIALVQKKFED